MNHTIKAMLINIVITESGSNKVNSATDTPGTAEANPVPHEPKTTEANSAANKLETDKVSSVTATPGTADANSAQVTLETDKANSVAATPGTAKTNIANNIITEDSVKDSKETAYELLKMARSYKNSDQENLKSIGSASQFYENGLRHCEKNNLSEALCCFDNAEKDAMKVLSSNRSIYSSGIIPIFITFGFLILFSYYLYLTFGMDKQPNIFGIPLWSAFLGGFGASIQGLFSIHGEKEKYSILPNYRQSWYAILPIIGLAFGYIAYVLVNIGLLVLGGGSSIPAVSQNATIASATSTVGNVSANVDTGVRLFLCFMAGYRTDFFDQKILKIWEMENK